ncbi:MAG TPA: hypothetical protein VKU41_09845 [Polyangiaceae bacterium]|nr:hypothetical protein [Polyangiaceae bacterium]
MKSLVLAAPTAIVFAFLVACQGSTHPPPPAATPGGPPGYGPAPIPNGPYAQPAPPAGYGPAPAPPNGVPAAPTNRPLLGPLVGSAAWQAEARAVLKEVVAHLPAQYAARVSNVPLVFDPNPNEVNAFASCDDSGAPFIAGTEGLLEAIDSIAETGATDELFGTATYGAYAAAVAPRLVTEGNMGGAFLPPGIVPAVYWNDPRRISRAHEIFDEIVAFTFGHELAHHYMGHTGCANGQAGGNGPLIEQLGQQLGRLLTSPGGGFNQPNEVAADTQGCISTLDAGRARSAVAYRWTEQGGLRLLDFFARLDQASGANPWLSFLRTHPNPGLRIPIVQAVAASWRLQHPG